MSNLDNLPVHPFTGLTAIGLRRNGQPIWPVLGAAEDDEPADDEPPAEPDPRDQLGDPGKKALDAMKAERNAALKAQKAAEARLKELEDRDKSAAEKDAERLATAEKKAAEAEARLLRMEVASEKGLNAAQAKRLVGTTREELEADADELIASFPAAPATGAPAAPPAPKPDPSQGPKNPGSPARPKSIHEAVKAAVASAVRPPG